MSVIEFDTGYRAQDDMKIHTTKHIRGALIYEPKLLILICQPPPYQNLAWNIREIKIPQAQIKSNISQSSKYRNDKHVALFCDMDIIVIPYFEDHYSEGTACDHMGFRQGPANLHFLKIPSMKSIGKLGCFDGWIRPGGGLSDALYNLEK